VGEVLETDGADSITRSSQEDTEAGTRGKVLETCATEGAGTDDAEEGDASTVMQGIGSRE